MSIGLIWGIIQVVAGISMLIEGYLVAINKIELRKSSIVINCIIIAVLFFSSSLRYF